MCDYVTNRGAPHKSFLPSLSFVLLSINLNSSSSNTHTHAHTKRVYVWGDDQSTKENTQIKTENEKCERKTTENVHAIIYVPSTCINNISLAMTFSFRFSFALVSTYFRSISHSAKHFYVKIKTQNRTRSVCQTHIQTSFSKKRRKWNQITTKIKCMYLHDKLEIKSLDALYNKNHRRHEKDEIKCATETTTLDAIWNRRKFYWFDKLLFYGMQVYYRNDFLLFLDACFCFIIGKLLQTDVYKIIQGGKQRKRRYTYLWSTWALNKQCSIPMAMYATYFFDLHWNEEPKQEKAINSKTSTNDTKSQKNRRK